MLLWPKLKCRRCWLTPGRPKCHKCCTALSEQREREKKRALFCWRPAAEAPNLYSLYWREAFFFPLPPARRRQIQSGQLIRALAAPLGRERNWELAWPWRATLIGFCCSHCGREENPISYVIMRQNSFLLAWSWEPRPSIEIPAAGCWFNFRLRDELARGRARFISAPIKQCVALRLVRPVCSGHKMSRHLWQEEPFVAEARPAVT